MADKNSYTIYNFPIDFIPLFIDNPDLTLNHEIIDFALIYALNDDSATAEDIERISKKFKLRLGNKDNTHKSARNLMTAYRKNPQPLTYIHDDLLWTLQRRYINEMDVMAIALMFALRSIGKKGMANKTNISMIAARMSGQSRLGKKPHKDVKRWTTRRKLENLKEYLQVRGLVYFPKGHSRGIVFWLTPPKYG